MKRMKGTWVKDAFNAGIAWFQHFRRQVDAMNVFPVPDGDTGKNMQHALQGARAELEGVNSNCASEVAWAAARGALMGGRGCSGMILSGFFTGFAEGVGDRCRITAMDLARAMQIGVLRARERVEHPVEGTILTVGEAAARHALQEAERSPSLINTIVSAWEGAREALKKTTRQLKVLEEHHVVDAGGMGLVYFLEGIVRYARRESLEAPADLEYLPVPKAQGRPVLGTQHKFCTEFVLHAPHATVPQLRDFLRTQGQEVMVAAAHPAHTFKAHVHVVRPEALFEQLAAWGTVTWRKVEDMEQQHQHAFQLKGE